MTLSTENNEISITLTLTPLQIAEQITFENSHLVACAVKDCDPEAARALYEELAYWADNNQI